MNKNLITREGKERFEQELRHLIEVEQPKNLEDLAAARAQGDLSENADYDAAKEKQAKIEGRIKQIEDILANATIIEESTSLKVRLGSTVRLLDLSDNTEATYTIVGSVEAKPLEGKISNECALGIALMDKTVGDVVLVKAASPYEVKVLEVK